MGSFLTIIIAGLTTSFALVKLEHLVSRKNPSISVNEEDLAKGETYNALDDDFMMAFSMEHFLTGPKNDLRYIQWVL